MIKLQLSEKPAELTLEIQKKLTQDFISSGKTTSVYKKTYIEESVRKLAFGKCCFSEIFLDTKSTYTEIEHFYPKDQYPDLVVEWGNLLPSCKKCNTSKGKTDTKKIEIVNPFKESPKDHLYFQNFRLYNKSKKGRNTIDYLSLNDRVHFTDPRAIASLKVIDLFESFYEDNKGDGFFESLSRIKRKNQVNRITGYFAEISRKTEFSACISTALLNTPFIDNLIKFLKNQKEWSPELQEYFDEIKFCSLLK